MDNPGPYGGAWIFAFLVPRGDKQMTNIEHAATTTAAYLGNHNAAPNEIPAILASVHSALGALSGSTEAAVPARPDPAVSVRKSYSPTRLPAWTVGTSLRCSSGI